MNILLENLYKELSLLFTRRLDYVLCNDMLEKKHLYVGKNVIGCDKMFKFSNESEFYVAFDLFVEDLKANNLKVLKGKGVICELIAYFVGEITGEFTLSNVFRADNGDLISLSLRQSKPTLFVISSRINTNQPYRDSKYFADKDSAVAEFERLEKEFSQLFPNAVLKEKREKDFDFNPIYP